MEIYVTLFGNLKGFLRSVFFLGSHEYYNFGDTIAYLNTAPKN